MRKKKVVDATIEVQIKQLMNLVTIKINKGFHRIFNHNMYCLLIVKPIVFPQTYMSTETDRKAATTCPTMIVSNEKGEQIISAIISSVLLKNARFLYKFDLP